MSPLKSRFFILVPSFSPSGPVKGAIALANGLAIDRDVVLISVKKRSGAMPSLNPNVKTIDLSMISKSYIRKILVYKKLLKQGGPRSKVASISFCFSADIINMFCSKQSLTCSSVRGNLPENYKYDFGVLGVILAYFHLYILNYIKRITVMSKSMSRQVSNHITVKPTLIRNFIDEMPLVKYRSNRNNIGPLRFAFVGSLTKRKCPDLVIKSIAELSKIQNVKLDVIGDGPLLSSLKKTVTRLGISKSVSFHGFLNNPGNVLGQVDAMVLPSFSEGIARSSLEALFLGVPCVLRNIDGNSELIENGVNGFLFSDDEELSGAILEAALLGRNRRKNRVLNLLPKAFRQQNCVKRFKMLMEAI
jgi:glycosyltransferase involved in cell wall biosynthesis